MGPHLITGRQHILQLKAADHMPQQQDTGQQRQTTTRCHRQGHPCTTPSVATLPPEANEQERRKAGQLPEHQHEQQVG